MFTLGSFGQVLKAVHQNIDIGKLNFCRNIFLAAVQADSQYVLMHSFFLIAM